MTIKRAWRQYMHLNRVIFSMLSSEISKRPALWFLVILILWILLIVAVSEGTSS